jgi:hypothetical protein
MPVRTIAKAITAAFFAPASVATILSSTEYRMAEHRPLVQIIFANAAGASFGKKLAMTALLVLSKIPRPTPIAA